LPRISPITAIIMRSVFNTVSKFLPGLFRDTDPITTMPFELVLALCGLGVALILIVSTKGGLGYAVSVR